MGARNARLSAYLIAVALLLGGGYGALSWLATPEPLKVMAKATPKPRAEAPPAEAKQDSLAVATHEEEKPSAQAVPPRNAQTAVPAATIEVAKTAKPPQARQARRRSGKQPLEVMTLRTVELPDGRRMTQLIPYRGGNRYRGDGPAMALEPDE